MSQACGGCEHFIAAPDELEREVAGLKILSSAYGSVRANTGLCRLHDLFCVPEHGCADCRRPSPLPRP